MYIEFRHQIISSKTFQQRHNLVVEHLSIESQSTLDRVSICLHLDWKEAFI